MAGLRAGVAGIREKGQSRNEERSKSPLQYQGYWHFSHGVFSKSGEMFVKHHVRNQKNGLGKFRESIKPLL